MRTHTIPGLQPSARHFTLPRKRLNLSPRHMQYKCDNRKGKKGATGSLANVQAWNVDAAGVLLVWQDTRGEIGDPDSVYVANGHNRVELGDRLDVQEYTIEFSSATTAVGAASQAALQNIREGNGSAVDAAKYFRTSGISLKGARDIGLPMSGAVVTGGLALARLSDGLFADVINGDLTARKGAIIGHAIKNHAAQHEFLDHVKAEEARKGKPLTEDALHGAAKVYAASSFVDVGEASQGMLGGMDGSTRQTTLFAQGEVSAYVRGRLKRAKRLFGGVSKHAQELTEGGNRIDAVKSKGVSQEAAGNLEVFDRLERTGVIAQTIGLAAVDILAGNKSEASIKQRAFDTIVGQIQALLGNGEPVAYATA